MLRTVLIGIIALLVWFILWFLASFNVFKGFFVDNVAIFVEQEIQDTYSNNQNLDKEEKTLLNKQKSVLINTLELNKKQLKTHINNKILEYLKNKPFSIFWL